MRISSALWLAGIVAAGPAAAQNADAPCATIKTTALPPCNVPGAPAAPALATLDGVPVTAAELDESLRTRRAGLDAAVAEARRAALQAEIDDALLELEAARREMSLPALLDQEVDRKAPAPTEADVLALYEAYKKWGVKESLQQLKPTLARQAREIARVRREAEFTRSLRDRHTVALGADAGSPGLAKNTVLGTVGARKITVASAATRLDAAGFAVRRDLYFDERAAFERLAHERLLRAEAGKRGVTPESLEKENLKIEEGHALTLLGEMPAPPALSLDLARGTSRGNPAALVTVVEWADFECPHCSHMWTMLEDALKPYGDRVRYLYLNFPLPFHEFAEKAAEAALAARAQGKFFEFASILFRNQKALDPLSLKKYAAEVGLDVARFAADLDGGRFAGEVLLEKRDGIRAGVLGTPFVFVNGVWLRWDKAEIADVRALVDGALSRAAAPAR